MKLSQIQNCHNSDQPKNQQVQKRKLPNWIDELLATRPTAGNGVHRWLFVTALKLHRYCPDKEELASFLDKAVSGCGREVTDREIEEAIRDSQRIVEGDSAETRIIQSWPNPNEELIQTITSKGPTLEQLQARSPIRWNDDKPHTDEIIDKLFPGNPLLCAGLLNTRARTQTREEWRGKLDWQQFIVPNAMSSVSGMTKQGRESMRTLNNVGPRIFVVVEFDQGSFDEHSALLVHLKEFAPLVLVVHSGGKSLHGWFHCMGQSDETIEKFFRYAVSLGADRATWTRCQFVRMPDGLRENGNRQPVMYFNPENLVQKI